MSSSRLYKQVAACKLGNKSIRRHGQCYRYDSSGSDGLQVNNKAVSLLLFVRSSSSSSTSNRSITSNTVPTRCHPITTRIIHSLCSSSAATFTTAAFSSSNYQHQMSSLSYPEDAVIHLRGSDLPYGSREYLLLPPHVKVTDLEFEPSLLLASIRAHRNILFDARMMIQNASSSSSSSSSSSLQDNVSDSDKDDNDISRPIEIKQQQEQQQQCPRLVHVCLPLVQAALQDAGSQGEQPQAISTLHGLSSWIVNCLEGRIKSQVLNNLLLLQSQQNTTTTTTTTTTTSNDDNSAAATTAADIALGAVRAIATGIPRPGHSVVGVGTYHDAKVTWQALAKEYVQLSITKTTPMAIKTKTSTTSTTLTIQEQQQQQYYQYGSQEAELYQAAGGQLVGIEYLADQQPSYLQSAGGAMARFFFL
jgi:hypothetical protein